MSKFNGGVYEFLPSDKVGNRCKRVISRKGYADMPIIGQKTLLEDFEHRVKNNHIARFIILVGTPKSGKTFISSLLANKIVENLLSISYIDKSVDSIRNMLDTAYKVADDVVYIIDNADSMSQAAKNALLKVTEEPPRRAYIIMVVENIKNIPETLVSRGTVFIINPYSKEELN